MTALLFVLMCAGGVIAGLAMMRLGYRRFEVEVRDVCGICKYNMHGLRERRCPECGCVDPPCEEIPTDERNLWLFSLGMVVMALSVTPICIAGGAAVFYFVMEAV